MVSVRNGRLQLRDIISSDLLNNIAGGVAYQFAPHARDAEYVLSDWVRRDITLGWVPVPDGWDVTLVCLSAEQVLQLEAVILSIRAIGFDEDEIDKQLVNQYRQSRRQRKARSTDRQKPRKTLISRANIANESLAKFRQTISEFKFRARQTHNALLW